MHGSSGLDRERAVAQRLCLLLCGTRDSRRRHKQEISRLAHEARPAYLADEMGRQRMLPLLGNRLIAEHSDGIDPGFSQSVEHSYELAHRRAAAFELGGDHVLGILADHGIEPMPLKGTTLARRLYGDSAMRSTVDLDLLVRSSELRTAIAALHGQGYLPPPDPVDRTSGLPRLHFQLDHADGVLPRVELHWRIHWYEERFSQDMLARGAAGSDGLLALPEDELASLLLFFARDGLVGLRLAADIAAWWDQRGDEIGPLGLEGIATRYAALRPALQVAATVARQWVGVPAGEPLLQGGLGWREETGVRLANYAGLGDPDQIASEVTLVDWLLSPKGGRAKAMARSFAPPAAGRGEIRDRPGGSRRSFERVTHPVKLLARYALALWRVRAFARHG